MPAKMHTRNNSTFIFKTTKMKQQKKNNNNTLKYLQCCNWITEGIKSSQELNYMRKKKAENERIVL